MQGHRKNCLRKSQVVDTEDIWLYTPNLFHIIHTSPHVSSNSNKNPRGCLRLVTGIKPPCEPQAKGIELSAHLAEGNSCESLMGKSNFKSLVSFTSFSSYIKAILAKWLTSLLIHQWTYRWYVATSKVLFLNLSWPSTCMTQVPIRWRCALGNTQSACQLESPMPRSDQLGWSKSAGCQNAWWWYQRPLPRATRP